MRKATPSRAPFVATPCTFSSRDRRHAPSVLTALVHLRGLGVSRGTTTSCRKRRSPDRAQACLRISHRQSLSVGQFAGRANGERRREPYQGLRPHMAGRWSTIPIDQAAARIAATFVVLNHNAGTPSERSTSEFPASQLVDSLKGEDIAPPSGSNHLARSLGHSRCPRRLGRAQ
jgi:hypothetical protein